MARKTSGTVWFVVLAVAIGLYNLGKHDTDTAPVSTNIQRVEQSPLSAPAPLFAKPTPSSVKPSPVTKTLRYVTATSLNVRSRPDAKSQVLLKVAKGSKIVTGASKGDWLEVELTNGSTGWVSAKFVTETAPQIYTPPARVVEPSRPPVANRNAIIQAIIAESITSTGGSCPCPYNRDRGGRSCGGRSAYSRPGGASPVCYSEQVTAAMIDRYLLRN